MAQVVQAVCPGCRQRLRIPAAWIDRPMKCKHCGLMFQARTRTPAAAPAPRPQPPLATPVNLARTPPPPARKPPVAVPVAPPPAAAPAGNPFGQLDFDTSAGPAPGRRYRRSRGGCWTGLILTFCILGVAVGATIVGWPYLSRLANSLPEVANALNNPDDPEHKPPTVRPVIDTAPKRVVATGKEETPPARSSEPARPKPVQTAPAKPPVATEKATPPPVRPTPTPTPPAVTGKFPRRALLISVNNYLYFNPISYGALSGTMRDVHTLVNQLNKGLDIPLDQVTELSDQTPDPTRRGRGPRVGAVAPVKSVIEQTVTDFLQTARAQDRIVLLFAGHAVEMDGEVFLVPIEGERDKKDSLIPLKWLYDKLAACKARQKVLILDVCRFDPSRGFERPGSGSPDAKTEGAMTAKIDEALKNPPPGVQLWSSCVQDQFSLEYENNSVFLESLWLEASHGIDGVIQRREASMPIDRLVDAVNKRMAEKLAPYKKAQTSRLVGKEPEEGAAYDPSEPLPPRVVPKGVALAQACPVDEVRKLLAEIDLPPIKATKNETPLQAEAMPPFQAKVMETYKEADGKDTPLREAVKAAITALGKTRSMNLLEEERYPGDENQQKAKLTEHQKRDVAGGMRELQEALDDLKKAGTPEARAAEPRRWQAHYDFVLARLEEELAYLNEYQGLLGQMKKELPPIDKKVQNGWRVASVGSLSDSTAKKLANEAKKHLEKIVKDYPNTPWEVLARRDKLTALGMEWQAARLQ
jgi:hypothetical protein